MVDRPVLLQALAAATDVTAAGACVVDALWSVDGLLPSLYLARAGRLRCQAARGYWQVRDGMSPGAGVVGRTFRTGAPTLELDVAATGDYLEAAPDVVSEACVPIRDASAQVIGCLNVESTRPAEPGLIDELTWCAEVYAIRLEELGGRPTSSPAERLVVHAARLAGMTDVRRIEGLLIDAARDISSMESAMLVGRDGAGGWRALAHAGELAVRLADSADAFELVESLVHGGTSCYTVAPQEGDRSHGSPVLAAAGAEGLIAVPIGPPGEPRSILVVADRGPVSAADTVELLELLAAHAASCLRTADAVAELRARAASDPLTGLGHHATFHEALAGARAVGSGVAVLIADIDGFKAINDSKGHQAGDRILREVSAVLTASLRRGDELFRIGGDEFAALVAVASDAEALEAGRRLCDAAARAGSVTVSIGIAVPREAESDAALLARADRALYQVKQAGRDGVELDA